MYLVNTGKRFQDRSAEKVDVTLPELVTSVSAADYNGDGLLDVYLSTYGLPGRDLPDEQAAANLLPEAEAEELFRRARMSSQADLYLNAVGPPNLLLVNRGEGRFAVAAENEQLEAWKNTLQATWSDFDNDGDADLYLANDYAPDSLFRNDREDGFEDVTRAVGGEAMMGFGMGASWGDYDNDGRQDLYVSNMFSKAGTRIAAQIPELDRRFLRSAQGNLLFRNAGSQFQLVSGTAPPQLAVAKAGWSWGGQFADFDNDGYLDIYVSSGYYTAPTQVAADVDL